MTDLGATAFATGLGPVGIAWGAGGVVGVALPERDEATTLRRLVQRCPAGVDVDADAEIPEDIHEVIARIGALLEGAEDDLADVRVDLVGVPAFHQRVYAVARAIPPGATMTYGEVATELGDPGAAQAVGQALGRNPVPIIVPCHRVLAAGGGLGGFSAPGGAATKRRMLEIEGAVAPLPPTLFDLDAPG